MSKRCICRLLSLPLDLARGIFVDTGVGPEFTPLSDSVGRGIETVELCGDAILSISDRHFDT